MSKFFSKEKVHNLLWALIGAFIIFLGGLLWNWWSGPEEVKVINSDLSKKDTTVTIIRFEPTGMLQYDSISNTKQELLKPKNNPTYQFNPALVDSIIKRTLSKQMTNENSIIQSSPTNPHETENIAEIYRPKFNMPTIVSGYTQGNVNSYATININKKEFIQTDFIEITTDFFKTDMLKKITPIFVDIVKRKTENSVFQIWSDQFKPTGTKTIIRFSASFPSDTYELTIGFYISDELNTKFPAFYSKRYNIKIN